MYCLSSGGWKPDINTNILGVFWLAEALTLTSALIFTWHSFCMCVCVQISLFTKIPVILVKGDTLLQLDLFLTTDIYKDPISK